MAAGPAVGRHLIIQQAVHAEEDGRGYVVIGQQCLFGGFTAAHFLIAFLKQDRDVLPDERVLLIRAARFDRLTSFGQIVTESLRVIDGRNGDLFIEARHAHGGGCFGGVLGNNIDQDLGVLVAFGDPGGLLRACRVDGQNSADAEKNQRAYADTF